MTKRLCRRSWGWWLVLLDRKHFKVKLLRFDKGKSLSQQCHKMRSELWLFLSGSGRFWNGAIHDEARAMQAGDFDLVPENCWHSFQAYEKSWVLEVQYGEKCEESDIVRL